MTVAGQARPAPTSGLAPAYTAIRTRVGLVVLLLVLAGLGWWWTAGQMQGMDAGPWTALGTFGWFIGVWVAMMAAMMFPSIAPTVALYGRMTRSRVPLAPLAFTAGYLLTWAVAGVAAFGVAAGSTQVSGDVLAWDHAGRALAGGTLMVAAAYELTPLKSVCLGKCRSPLGSLLGSWRGGWLGGLRMGMRNGAWCVGCCWALMASLFALGVMSISWMALVAGLIAIEKTVPWTRTATYATTAVLAGLGVLLLAAPGWLPGLTLPGGQPMPMPGS
jgi:predicted metal-binding membrane protein